MTGPGTTLRCGLQAAKILDGNLGAVTVGDVEVLRGLSYPVRNPDWGTFLTGTLSEETTESSYVRRFACRNSTFTGLFRVVLEPGRLVADVEMVFPGPARINRAGFTLLHPIRNVAGTPLTIHHPGGGVTETHFPALISPDQPARDIVGLRHSVGGVTVDIAMEGDVFEMEDQRNWSDASFKTYCRPLALPYPYPVAASEIIRQRVTLTLGEKPDMAAIRSLAVPVTVQMPQVLLAHEAGLSQAAALTTFPDLPVQVRVDSTTPDDDLKMIAIRHQIALELVFDDMPDLLALIGRIKAAGLHPDRVVALPRAFLKSYQPDAEWPTGAQPADAPAILRAAFPRALAGGGSLTNFTELNRCRPDPETVDFLSFGNTAIVHAADDLSVCQTLEALPDIFASAAAIAAGKPLHLGLVSIGMRCNPYGDKVAPNPQRVRCPMAMDDPRQDTGFAAAYAVTVLARAALAGVSSLALAMADGPLGARGPLASVLRQAARLSGRPVQVCEIDGCVSITSEDAGLMANWSAAPVRVPQAGGATLPPEAAIVWNAAGQAGA